MAVPPAPPLPSSRFPRAFVLWAAAVALTGLAAAWLLRSRGKHPSAPPAVTHGTAAKSAPEPADAAAYVARGQARMAKGDFEGAVADGDRALDLDSTLASAYRMRGEAKLRKGDFEGAIEDCSHALNLDGDDVDAAVTRGHARQAAGDLDGAISDFTRAISRAPQNAAYYELRGVARVAKGNIASAMGDFQRAVELDPKLAAAYRDQGELRMRDHDLEGAASDFDLAIFHDPRDVRAYNNRREVRLLRGETKGALDDATTVVKLDPQNPLAYRNRGMNYMLVRQWPEALADYRKYFELSKVANDDPHLYVWIIRTRLGETEAANAELANYFAKRPAATAGDWHASAAGFLLGQVSEDKLLAASTAPESFAARRRQCQAWYYIGMKKVFAKDPQATESLARCIMDDQLATPEFQLAVTELGTGRAAHRSPQEALIQFIKAIPFKNAYTSKSDEHSVTLLSQKPRDGQQGVRPEAVLDFYGPMPWNSEESLEEHLHSQIDNIRQQFPIAPYTEKDHAPSDNVVHFIETIEGVPVGFIKYWLDIPNSATPPCALQAVILKDKKQYTLSLTTFVPETQEGYRQDERLLIKTLIKNGKL